MAILSILTAIGTFLAGVGTQVLDALKMTWDAIWRVISTFIDNAPTPLKIFLFLFMLVTIGNLFSNFFLGSSYMCNSSNQLYKAPDLVTGIGNSIRLNMFEWTISDRDVFIQSNYDREIGGIDTTNVQCRDNKARLFFYNVDVFSYNLWILLLILMYGTPLAIKYYKSMGALH